MPLPTQAEVNAATRHIASFAGGAIVMFGLSTKVDPQTVQDIIMATGKLVSDLLVLAGLISPFTAAWYARRSATPDAQSKSLERTAAANALSPAAQKSILNAAGDVPGTEKVVNPRLSVDPATSNKVVAA